MHSNPYPESFFGGQKSYINFTQIGTMDVTTTLQPEKIELMEENQMKDPLGKHPEFDPETYTDPILEECYRIKAEISAQFETLDEFFAYLKAMEEEEKRNGIKYVSYFDPAKHKLPEKSDDEV